MAAIRHHPVISVIPAGCAGGGDGGHQRAECLCGDRHSKKSGLTVTDIINYLDPNLLNDQRD